MTGLLKDFIIQLSPFLSCFCSIIASQPPTTVLPFSYLAAVGVVSASLSSAAAWLFCQSCRKVYVAFLTISGLKPSFMVLCQEREAYVKRSEPKVCVEGGEGKQKPGNS